MSTSSRVGDCDNADDDDDDGDANADFGVVRMGGPIFCVQFQLNFLLRNDPSCTHHFGIVTFGRKTYGQAYFSWF